MTDQDPVPGGLQSPLAVICSNRTPQARSVSIQIRKLERKSFQRFREIEKYATLTRADLSRKLLRVDPASFRGFDIEESRLNEPHSPVSSLEPPDMPVDEESAEAVSMPERYEALQAVPFGVPMRLPHRLLRGNVPDPAEVGVPVKDDSWKD